MKNVLIQRHTTTSLKSHDSIIDLEDYYWYKVIFFI